MNAFKKSSVKNQLWMKCLSSLEGTRLLVVKAAMKLVLVFSVIALLTWTSLEEKQTGINWIANTFLSLSSEILTVNSTSELQGTSALPYKYFNRELHPSNTSQRKLLTESLPLHLCSVAVALCENTEGWERAKLLNRAHAQTKHFVSPW